MSRPTPRRRAHALPGGKEAPEGLGLDGLHLLAQGRERALAELAQHLGVAPLALGAFGPELAAQQRAGLGPAGQQVVDQLHGQPETLGGLDAGERRVRAGPAGQERTERVVDGLEEDVGQPGGKADAQRVAVAAGVLGGDEALLAGDAHDDGPALGDEGVGEVVRRARGQLLTRQVAEAAQQVVGGVGVAGPPPFVEILEVGLEVGQRLGLDQLAQLLGAEEVGQQVAVEGEGLRLALGDRSVALVQEVGDVGEGERRGERRRPPRVDRHHTHVARPHVAHQLDEGRDVEGITQALAIGLEKDRERAVLRRHREQVGGPLALLPQRRPRARSAPGQQQGPGRVLAEPSCEQRGVGQLRDDEVLHLLGLEEDTLDGRHVVGLGQPHDDALVAPHGLNLEAEAALHLGLDGEGPRRVHAAAERREHAHPPVAQLVAKAFDHDLAVGREGARDLPFLGKVRPEVADGPLVERALLGQPLVGPVVDLAQELAQGPPQLVWPPEPVAVPERHLPGLAGRGRDDDAVAGDLLDAPRGGAEHERLPHPGLVDHLLVELADARPSGVKTPYRPRSGMVPPLVTASIRAPGRARSVSAVRSQTIRGRSSANSSDG